MVAKVYREWRQDNCSIPGISAIRYEIKKTGGFL